MILTASFLLLCVFKLARDRGICKKCLVLIPLLATIVCWHFYSVEIQEKFHPSGYKIKEHKSGPLLLEANGSESERLPPVPETQLNDKWIVVTSSSSRSQSQLQIFSQIPDWTVVFVAGDPSQSISSWRTIPGVIFLDIVTQLSLGYHITQHLPLNSNSRKGIGYLFAMQHGARIIYDAELDDLHNFDHLTTDNSQNFAEGQFPWNQATTRSLLLTRHQDGLVVNPYSHFGQGSVYPRGYPWQELVHKEYNNTYTVCPKIPTPLIQQGVISGRNSDVDAYWRETETRNTALNFQFDPFAPPVIFPSGIFGPFNSRSTIFHYAAFWGLILPGSLPNRVSDVWRGYFVQRLLWVINGNLGYFLIKNSTKEGNKDGTNSSLNVQEESHIHNKGLRLIQSLAKWELPSNLDSFYDAMIHLSETLAQNGDWSEDDVKLVQAWIKDLQRVGYKEPDILDSSLFRNSTPPCRDEKGESSAIFYPVKMEHLEKNQPSAREELSEFCNFTRVNETEKLATQITFPSTLLIVTFNEVALTKNIWLLDLIYRLAYPNIVYCMPLKELSHFKKLASKGFGAPHFSVVTANTTRGGNFAYECTLRAIEMNYGVSEYFVLQDDVLLNYWNNLNFKKDQMWIYRSGERILDTRIPYGNKIWSGWNWWRSVYGLNATKAALKSIYSQKDNAAVARWRYNRAKFGFKEEDTMYGETDSYHVPGEGKEIFYEVGCILRKFQVYIEIGVHLILSGISSRKDVVVLEGISLWGGARRDPLKYFSASNSVIHPVKLSQVFGNPRFRTEYCDKYVRHVVGMEEK